MAQEREYSKLIDNANAPIFGVDTQGRVNIWNKCARKLVGYTLDEVMGQNLVGEFITKEYRAAVSAVLDKALKGEETANFGKFELGRLNTHLSRWKTSFFRPIIIISHPIFLDLSFNNIDHQHYHFNTL